MTNCEIKLLLSVAAISAARPSGAFTNPLAYVPLIRTKTKLCTGIKLHNRLNRLNSASQDTDLEIAETNEDEPWALRQITFLDLTAGSSSTRKNNEQSDLDARNFSEFLMEIGACSVSITDADANTSKEDPLFHEPSLTTCPNDYLEDGNDFAMVLNDVAAGRNVWKRCHVSAHFPSSLFDVPTIIDALRYTFQIPTTPRFEVDTVPDLDWIKHVQESWNPIVTKDSKFVLRFPWHEDSTVMKACQDAEKEKMMEDMAKRFSSGVKREGAVVHFEEDDNEPNPEKKDREYVQIRLEGGIAFGTGEHPTTRLCLDWIRDKVEVRLENVSEDEKKSLNICDYGSGSGVLGIAAGAVIREYMKKQKNSPRSNDLKANVIGLEIDADAIHIANDNSKKNDVRMANYLPDPESLDEEALSVVLRAMQRKRNKDTIQYIPSDLNGPIYDLLIANILAGPLVKLAPTIASLVKNGGEIGLSGILATQANSVVEAYGEFFEDVQVAAEEGGWVLVTGKRKKYL